MMEENLLTKKTIDKKSIPWPITKTKEKKIDNSETDIIFKAKRGSVNIDRKRKESKRLLSNFKVENNDKSYWNSPYPIIEYPE